MDKAYRNDTAHQDSECSKAGVCDTETGKCTCFQGFSGAACQRSSCPSGCNDRGVCMSMRDMSVYHGPDYDSTELTSGDGRGVEYSNWDADAIMMCRCDPPYFGPDCGQGLFFCLLAVRYFCLFSDVYFDIVMCPKGDDPLTLNQDLYSFTIEVWSGNGLSGTLGINFQDGISNFQLDGPSSAQCESALEASGKFRSVACVLLEISDNLYQYNVTVLEWPISPKENNLYSHEGNPPASDFHCDTSGVSSPARCQFAVTDSTSVKGTFLCA